MPDSPRSFYRHKNLIFGVWALFLATLFCGGLATLNKFSERSLPAITIQQPKNSTANDSGAPSLQTPLSFHPASTPQAPNDKFTPLASPSSQALSDGFTNKTSPETTPQLESTRGFITPFIFAEESEFAVALPTPLYEALRKDAAHLTPEETTLIAQHALKNVDPRWRPLIDRLTTDGFSLSETLMLFSRLGPKSYSPAFMAAKVTELHGVYGVGIKRNDEQAPILPEGYAQPLSSITAGSCIEFMRLYEDELQDIHKRHGVPANVIVGLLLIETGLGSDLGNDSALRALASMAATTTPELLGSEGNNAQIQRISRATLRATLSAKSAWAYEEVKALLQYGCDQGIDVANLPGSMYGAIGICQFMPSNIAPYAIDGDNDGKVNIFSVPDAMYSVANYLEAYGWRSAKTQEQKFAVIRQYNHDDIYASRVLGVAHQIALAEKGKISQGKNPLAVAHGIPGGYRDPSLKGRRSVPRAARIATLSSYQELLQ